MNTRDPNTYLRGEACYQAKLTEANVIDARKRVKSGASLKHVAERIGIKRKTLADAVNGRTWKHLAGAAVLAAGMTMTAMAHAESWIIVVSSADAPANDNAFEAMVDPYVYKTVDQCLYKKGIWEGFAAAIHPQSHYNVWCAIVPGLAARK